MKKTLFNGNWLFYEFDLETSLDEMVSSDKCKNVNLPHDYMIYHVNDLYKNGIGFYKKTFTINPLDNHTYILRFEGVYMDSKVYCNGNLVIEWKYGYSTFDADLTPYLKDGKNTVCVTVTYQSPNTRWYSGAGIYRNVWFIDKDYAYLPLDGSYISTKKVGDDFEVTVDIEAVAKMNVDAKIEHTLVDKEGNVVCALSDDVLLTNEVSIDTKTFLVKAPRLWDIADPYFYTLKTSLTVNGTVLDYVENPLGFRTINFDPNAGFFLNGRSVKLFGVCQHHDLGALGAAMNKVALRRQFEKLMKMGVNSIRTSHNMPAKEVMELADEMGLLIYSESFDMWELPKTKYDYGNYFPTWYTRDVKSWVRRDRNHPSLIIWGIGNEIYDTHAGSGLKWTKLLRDCVRENDIRHNAYIGIGSNYIEWENAQKCSDELELSGYNYGERLYDEHHKKYPHWNIFGSETSSTVQSRGIYHFPYETRILTHQDGQCSSLGNCTTNWGAIDSAFVIAAHRDRDYVSGQYLWSGWDYIGEPTPFHSKNSFFGQIDTAGFEKDTFYQYQAEWTSVEDNPMVHLLPYWDFNEGEEIDVCAYSNAPYVELFFNGNSLGKQFIDHEHSYDLKGHWKLPYKKGEIKVEASLEDGTVVATDLQRSFSDPKNIVLKADKDVLLADSMDCAFIEISMEDENGTFVANAKNRVFVDVKGEGVLLGLDNGDSTDYEEYKCTSKRLFSGKLLAIVGSTNKAGNIEITVSSKGMEDKKIVLTSTQAEVTYDERTVECLASSNADMDDVPVRKVELIYSGDTHLTKENSEIKVEFKVYPENATYDNIVFTALTKDSVEANFATVTKEGNYAIVKAIGDGDFVLTAFAYNDKDHPEIVSTLNFSASGLGFATQNPYKLIPGIQFNKAHTKEAKLSFLGGVFLPPNNGDYAYVTYNNVDFGAFGADTIHIPVFSFHDDVPVKIFEGTIEDGECLYEGMYHAPTIYNTYQENVYKLSRKLKGTTTITLAFKDTDRFSVHGFYFEKPDKTYSRLSALDNSMITGDSFTIESDAITSIGNNVALAFDEMNFDKGLSGIKILCSSPNETTSIHILFIENGNITKQLIEVPGSKEYQEHFISLESTHINGEINLLFLPGSNFNLKEFEFIKE